MVEFKVGDKVELVSNKGGSNNPIGSIGVITEVTPDDCRVMVEGVTDNNMVNWQYFTDLKLVE